MTFDEHDHRRAVVAEMHLRRWPHISAPSQVVQFLRTITNAERGDEITAVVGVLPASGDEMPRHLAGRLAPGVEATWERHSEASTLTLFLAPEASQAAIDKALAWAAQLPGKVIRATRLHVVVTEAEAQARLSEFGFSHDDLVTCRLCPEGRERAARIWSDFRLRDDGFGDILIAAADMPLATLSRTLQRLQELGNYRNLALLGLPIARQGWSELDRIEGELDKLNLGLTRPEVTDDELMALVSELWRDLIAQLSSANYRISATEAYAAIVEERLADLCIEPCSGHLSLADFTQRRFLPAVRTCMAHRRRAESLAQRTSQVVGLLRTRIETRIENQNARVLASLERSAQRQLRLQQLVEGLSVIPISYYALAIVDHLIESTKHLSPGIQGDLLTPALTPAVVAAVWFILRRQQRKIAEH